MNYSHLPPYGHAMCPHCCTEFDLTGAQPSFVEKCPHNDYLVYVMCPKCAKQFRHGSSQEQKAMSNSCFVNFKVHGRSDSDRVVPWAVTTSLTLALNDDDFIRAIEDGHGLSPDKYFEICASEKTILNLPGGICLVVSNMPGDQID
jgi:hypothetical protein